MDLREHPNTSSREQAMDPRPEKLTPDVYELDRQAWNLPLPPKRPQTSQAPSSVQSGREDKTEAETKAA
jgi:hypothetical protein